MAAAFAQYTVGLWQADLRAGVLVWTRTPARMLLNS